MALGDYDAIRDAGINAGIGSSPLLSQAIQRQGIEDLKSLNSNLAQSRATMENERKARLAEAQAEFAKNGVASVEQGVSSARVGSGVPRYILRPSANSRDALLRGDVAAPGTDQFELVSSELGVSGGSQRVFKSIDELQQFLNENPEVRTNLATVEGDPIAKALAGTNVGGFPQIGIGQLARILSSGRTSESPFKFAAADGSGKGKVEDYEVEELKKLRTGDYKSLDFGKISHNTQARIIQSGLDRVATVAKAIPTLTSIEDFSNLSPTQQVAYAIGRSKNLSEKAKAIKSAIKNGLLPIDFGSRED